MKSIRAASFTNPKDELKTHKPHPKTKNEKKKKKCTNIFMIHMTQKLDFPQSPLGINFIIKSIGYLLHGNMLSGLRIDSRATEIK